MASSVGRLRCLHSTGAVLKCVALLKKEAEQANERARVAMRVNVLDERSKVGKKRNTTRGTSIGYTSEEKATPEEIAKLGRYGTAVLALKPC